LSYLAQVDNLLKEELIVLVHRPWQDELLLLIKSIEQVPQVEQAVITLIKELTFQLNIKIIGLGIHLKPFQPHSSP
jgi:hypothetical protein